MIEPQPLITALGGGDQLESAMNRDQIAVFVKKRVVPIIGKVNYDMYRRTFSIISELLLQGAPDILVVIDSNGGDTGFGLDIYDLIKTYPGQTTGMVFRMAASMGATILQACTKRLCAEHGEIMIHYITQNNVPYDVVEDLRSRSLKQVRASMKRTQRAIYGMLARHSGKSEKEIRAACRKTSYMLPPEAKKFGLIDGVIERTDMAKWFRPDVLDELKKGGGLDAKADVGTKN